MNPAEHHRLLLAHSDTNETTRLRFLLERAGFSVCGTTNDGGELLRLAQTRRPELIVLDLQLSYQNGLEVLRRVKEREPQIKCLVLGAYSDEIFARVIAAGAAAVLSVPCSDARVLECIDQLLSPAEPEWTPERVEPIARVILANLRAPVHRKGYRYVLEGLNIVLADQTILARRGVFRELYEPIGRRYGATGGQVERAMRGLTAHIFQKADRTMLERYLPAEDVARGRISNTRFLAALSGCIYRQGRREQLRTLWG